jgi:hypothetical protein
MTINKHLNFEWYFKRRRYGSRVCGTTRFFTWVHYRVPNSDRLSDHNWKEYGDPWPKVRPNKKEVGEMLSKITLRVLPIGQRVNTHSGKATILGVDGDYFLVRLDNYSQTDLRLHPGHITEVL